MKKHIPNMITACNLICGAMATFFAVKGIEFQQAFLLAFACICGGAFFDFFDGMTARKLGVSGPLGIQMDSLADDITFGLAPSMMLCAKLWTLIGWFGMGAFIMAAFSALRLAKFNIDTRQTTSFIGLATPANALFWGGICCMPYAMFAPAWAPWVLLILSFGSCYLLVSEIPFFSLKFKDFTWQNNAIRYIFLIGDVLLIAFCVIEAIRFDHVEFAVFAGTACIIWYVLINLLNLFFTKK